MCIARDIVTNGLNQITYELELQKELLNEQVSDITKKINHIQHELTITTFNASQGYRILKHQQDLLIERRKLKGEMAIIDQALQVNERSMGISQQVIQNSMAYQENLVKDTGVIRQLLEYNK
ncbi:hypothetical protein [Brevibacillus sp. NRS-1366]|uniref:hypothetical protein n=1 Tax=Brevibacillus sp. NRS-1366 TaxID=3233899 RepID=UPI003D19092B